MSDLLKKIKSLYHQKIGNDTYVKEGIRPSHDWYAVLISFVVVFCVISFVAYYFYVQIDQGNLFISEKSQVEQAVTIDEKLLKKVTDDIKVRDENLASSTKISVPTDPSL
ncbi:MAG: hypothetical protein WCK48_01865 [bacterium]